MIPVSPRQSILRHYLTRRETFSTRRENIARRARRISLARLVIFLLAAVLIIGALGRFFAALMLPLGLGILFLLVFIVLVLWHDRVLRARDRLQLLSDINDEAMRRMEREWAELPPQATAPHGTHHALALDLDLFASAPGGASLFQLLGTAGTPRGRETLRDWLLSPAGEKEIPIRQEAVKELQGKLDWRQQVQLHGRALSTSAADIEKFLQWAEAPPWLLQRTLLFRTAQGLSALPTLLLALNVAGVIPPWWILSAMVNLLFFGLFSKPCHAAFELVSSRERHFRNYGELFKLLANTAFQSVKLQALKRELAEDSLCAHRQMRRLDHLSSMADVRFSPMLYLPLQAMFLWSFHVLGGLERWQQNAGKHGRRWFDVLGEYEALSALGGLAHDHPGWGFPTVTRKAGSTFEGRGLGHPLLHPDACVTNSVRIGPRGSFQMITGSNMSGKSTLLRAVGLNVVLAQAGGPVFAESLVMPPTALGTSFRIQDSLQAGVSFFMAELRRLKEIVDQAGERNVAEQGCFLYLLDEILQGTNVAERQVAVQSVVRTLLDQGAVGAISTHDLSLAEVPDLEPSCQPFHFTETYRTGADGPTMHFDYTLRPGVAPTVNALKLLEIVGLTQ